MRRRAANLCVASVADDWHSDPAAAVARLPGRCIMASTWSLTACGSPTDTKQVLAALECNAQYAQYRREHGDAGSTGH